MEKEDIVPFPPPLHLPPPPIGSRHPSLLHSAGPVPIPVSHIQQSTTIPELQTQGRHQPSFLPWTPPYPCYMQTPAPRHTIPGHCVYMPTPYPSPRHWIPAVQTQQPLFSGMWEMGGQQVFCKVKDEPQEEATVKDELQEEANSPLMQEPQVTPPPLCYDAVSDDEPEQHPKTSYNKEVMTPPHSSPLYDTSPHLDDFVEDEHAEKNEETEEEAKSPPVQQQGPNGPRATSSLHYCNDSDSSDPWWWDHEEEREQHSSNNKGEDDTLLEAPRKKCKREKKNRLQLKKKNDIAHELNEGHVERDEQPLKKSRLNKISIRTSIKGGGNVGDFDFKASSASKSFMDIELMTDGKYEVKDTSSDDITTPRRSENHISSTSQQESSLYSDARKAFLLECGCYRCKSIIDEIMTPGHHKSCANHSRPIHFDCLAAYVQMYNKCPQCNRPASLADLQ